MDLWTAGVMKNSGSSVPGLRSPEVGNQILEQVLVNRSSNVGCVGRERGELMGTMMGCPLLSAHWEELWVWLCKILHIVM